jgi:hypothetical protein
MARGTSFLDVFAVIRPTVLVQRLIDTHTHTRMDENVNKYVVWYH